VLGDRFGLRKGNGTAYVTLMLNNTKMKIWTKTKNWVFFTERQKASDRVN
jgi:hypothetical protein